jgi:hypothetical protein
MMTMKEACEYVKNSRLAKAKQHRIDNAKYGECKGLTQKEYNRMYIKGKGAGSKGRSYSHNKIWVAQGKSERIHTFYHKKWNLQN